MTLRTFGFWQLVAYGALGLPLAMAALPLYVHLPKFYGGVLGMDLALVGGILLATRLGDAVSDPVLGWLSDRVANRRLFVALALPLLGLGMIGLFHPPADRGAHAAWLGAMLVVVYLGFSAAAIAYYAWGAQLSPDVNERTRITATREVFTLVGVVVAAALPQALGGESDLGLQRLSFVFAALLVVFGAATLALSPRPPARQAAAGSVISSLKRAAANRGYMWLLAVFVPSGIAAAIPSTLVLFFIEDVLDAPGSAGLFLVLYFVSGAAGMPFWVWLSRRLGKKYAWLVGMIFAVVAFVWAFGLGAGDVKAFAAICVLSGLALGADLALPPSLLADVIDEDRSGRTTEGAYFGVWALATKLNLALAAGIALPLLDWLGYQPGVAGAERSLAIAYALLPCVFKLASAAILWASPLARKPAAAAAAV
jgi:glycoside/pentoside/hexuronide:cation symporter, GPH family